MLFPNIFQVISANQIFKYSGQGDLGGMGPDEFYDKYGISDEDLYKILKAMYGYDAGDLGADDLNAGINNVKSELDSKYYVTLASDNAEDLFNEIIGLKEDFGKLRVNNDDAVGDEKARYMVQDQRDTQDLYPLLDATDIAALIEGSGKLNMASISILTDTGITSSTIEKVGDKDRIVFEVTGRFNSEADGASDAKMYAPLFPEKMSVIVTITEEVTNTGADEAKELATTYNLNGIEDDLMTKTMFFVARLSGKNDMTKESVEEDISKQINEAFDSLTSDGAVTLDIDGENENVRLGNVFEVATAAIWEEDGTISEDRPSDDEFRSTIKALWAGLDGYDDKYANGAGIKALNYDVETAKFSVNLSDLTSNSVMVTGSTMISDAFIGSQLASEENIGKIASALKVYSGGISLYQSYILPVSIGDEAESEYKERYDAIVSYFGKDGIQLIDDGSANLLFTFIMTKDAFELEEADNIAAFIPDEMYLSAAISATENSEIGDIKVSINNLDDTQLGYVAYVLEKAGYASEGEGQSAGVFGGDYAELAEEIKEIKLVELKKEEIVEKIPGYEIEGFDEGLIVKVKDLFSADGTMKFAYQITDDIAQEDQEENYIYQDYYVGEKVALGYLAYSYEDTFTLTSSGGEGQG